MPPAATATRSLLALGMIEVLSIPSTELALVRSGQLKFDTYSKSDSYGTTSRGSVPQMCTQGKGEVT